MFYIIITVLLIVAMMVGVCFTLRADKQRGDDE